jgi:endonuclease IV
LTLQHLDQTVGLQNIHVWHSNDTKAERGSRLDRHEHIGRGKLGLETFRALLNDRRLKHAAFIAETPIDEPGDDLRNVATLKALVKGKNEKTQKNNLPNSQTRHRSEDASTVPPPCSLQRCASN